MTFTDYHWAKIGWKEFEEMCVYLAECFIKERRFELYGRPGEGQEGIDIISKNERGEDLICIQCKRYTIIDSSLLKKIISKFESGEFLKLAKTFILATRAPLNSKALLRQIASEKIRLKKQYNIDFETWDVHYIEKELSNHYTLACKYFGIELAEAIWSGTQSASVNYQPVKHYLQRQVIPYKEDDGYSRLALLGGRRLRTGFLDLFTNELHGPKKYCLVADAYQGKSTLFEQLAYDLSVHPLKLKPVFLRLRDYSHRSLIDTLDVAFSWWRVFPVKELVIIIDGLDEVDSGRFLDALKNINELSLRFPSLAIVFSCRKLFFHHEEVPKWIKGFLFYELYPIQESQVDQYLSDQLPGTQAAFLEHIHTYDLDQFLYHPFYLKGLVEIFTNNHSQLPKSKPATIKYFINKSFDAQSLRPLTSGTILKRKEQRYTANLRKAAFAMQLLGKNTLSDNEAQLVFSNDSDVELLKHGSLLSFSNEKWTFQNAMFQEFLSAEVLAALTFPEITNLVCVGKKIKKVKTKWIQTIVSLLSILSATDKRRSQLFGLLRKDNIELITLCDSDLLSASDRLELFQQLLKRYEHRGLRPMVVYEDTIGRFFRGLPMVILAIIKTISRSRSDGLKRTLWRILQYIDLPEDMYTIIQEIAKKEISKTSQDSYARDILYKLGAYAIGSKDVISFLIEQHHLNSKLNYRDGVYDMIVQKELADEFYDYGIQGIGVMYTTPADNFMRSEHSLEQLLLSTRTRKNIEKLFAAISSDQWVNFRRYKYSGDESFILRLASVCNDVHASDPLVIFSVIHFIKDLEHKYLRDEFKDIDQFFVRTETCSFVIRYFIHLPVPGIEWQLGPLVTSDAFGFLFDYYEEKYINADFILLLLRSVYYFGNKDLVQELNELYVGATGNEDSLAAASENEKMQEAYQKKKQQNDIAFIRNQETFTKATKLYFKTYGQTCGTDVTLNYDHAHKGRSHGDSNFIAHFIIWQIGKEKPVKLSHCLEAIANKEYFDRFRISELLDYASINDPGKESLKQLLQQLYNEKIAGANFQSAVRQQDDTYWVARSELLLSRVFEKMEFTTDYSILIDMLCMDRTGFSNFREQKFTTDYKPSLSEKILGHLSKQQLNIAAKIIVDRLRRGILAGSVMENHIALCGHLGITEARPLILSLMIDKKIRSYNMYEAVRIYLKLGGDLGDLLPVLETFDNYNDQAYHQLIMKMNKYYPLQVKESLLKAMNSPAASIDNRIEFAYLLTSMGEIDGFLFLIEQMSRKENMPFGKFTPDSFKNIDTIFVLNHLPPHMYHVFEEDEIRGTRRAIKSMVVDILFAVATKSEKDLVLVDQFLQDVEKKYKGTILDLSILHWYRERILENFRATDEGHNSLHEVLEILSRTIPNFNLA